MLFTLHPGSWSPVPPHVILLSLTPIWHQTGNREPSSVVSYLQEEGSEWSPSLTLLLALLRADWAQPHQSSSPCRWTPHAHGGDSSRQFPSWRGACGSPRVILCPSSWQRVGVGVPSPLPGSLAHKTFFSNNMAPLQRGWMEGWDFTWLDRCIAADNGFRGLVGVRVAILATSHQSKRSISKCCPEPFFLRKKTHLISDPFHYSHCFHNATDSLNKSRNTCSL